MKLVPYLNFPGNTSEAMAYYQEVFGGELTISTFGELEIDDMPADGTMHAHLDSEYFEFMASDAMPGAEESWGGTRVYLAVVGSEADQMKLLFDKLAADGEIGMPLEQQIWGDMFGIVTDKYGLEWMFNIDRSQDELLGAP